MPGWTFPCEEVSFNDAERGQRYLTKRGSYVATVAIHRTGHDLNVGEGARRYAMAAKRPDAI
jgi:hypothetical protein